MVDKPLANRLREMILQGELKPGERLTEMALASRLGISRTPIRQLLPSLAAEGFLTPVGRRGFAVAQFSDRESREALELRALLEGQAARMVAREGASPELLRQLEDCLNAGDALFRKGHLEADDREAYGEMNERFHTLIVEAANSPLLSSMVERLNHVPFVAPSIPVFDRAKADAIFTLLLRAHGHHHAIVEAIREQDGARAETLFREHANSQRQSTFDEGGHREAGAVKPKRQPRSPPRRAAEVQPGRRPLIALP